MILTGRRLEPPLDYSLMNLGASAMQKVQVKTPGFILKKKALFGNIVLKNQGVFMKISRKWLYFVVYY